MTGNYAKCVTFSECQVQHWPKHKQMCEVVVQAMKAEKSNIENQ